MQMVAKRSWRSCVLAIGLAEVLLNANSTAITVTVFAVVGAIILAGTTLLALRPWEKK